MEQQTPISNFHITRIYSDSDGHSHFADLLVPLSPSGPIGSLSEKYKVENLIFREVVPEYDYAFHQAPARQFIILLDGQLEIETSMGDKRTFGPGEILLVEDTEGKGHRSRNLLPVKRKSVFITLAEE